MNWLGCLDGSVGSWLLKCPLTGVARWRKTVCVSSQPYLQEWEHLMNQGMETCLAFVVEDSEHATELRQSSPFAGLLSHQDRFVFLKTWKQNHAAC